MKIAITSSGNSMDASIDNRFGRCSYFAFYDTETLDIEFIPNPNKDCSMEPDLHRFSLLL